MAEPAQVLEDIFTVIEGGKDLGEAAKIIQFPSDNGQKVYEAVEMTQQGSNGTGLNYWAAAIVSGAGTAARALSSGAIMLGMEVGVVGAAIAPALGLLSGYVLYNLSPEFWDGIANALIEAGETVKGKVVAYMNEDGILTFSEDTIEIFKNKFLEEGLFNDDLILPEYQDTGTVPLTRTVPVHDFTRAGLSESTKYSVTFATSVLENLKNEIDDIEPWFPPQNTISIIRASNEDYEEGRLYTGHVGAMFYMNTQNIPLGTPLTNVSSRLRTIYANWRVTSGNVLEYTYLHLVNVAPLIDTDGFTGKKTLPNSINTSSINAEYKENDAKQEGADVPDEDPFPLKYPDWLPYDFPVVEGQTIEKRYPLEYPDSLPAEEPYQTEAQNPDTENAPEPAIETIANPASNPNQQLNPEDEPIVDPEPQPVPEPIPVPEIEPAPDPVEPDPPSPITPVIPVPAMPSTISSNRLFTVYNPSASQLDQLGAYLWDSDLIDILKKIWQNPLDGIISLTQVFVTPPTNGSHNIILGYLDSEVNAPVVSNQFVTVDCGTVNVDEICNNCLDYVPYTQLQLYLPFIGITEIDTNEFMAGSINVKYHVDVYTGSCLAEVKCTRSRDLANGTILYTFNGNCSQQLPLTSGDAKGVLTALIGAAGAGLSIASGGEFGMLAGARMVSSNIAKGMLHVSHSGNLSANSGIMGQKKPYLIINRERAYTATSYNKIYGFPANKMLYPGNHSGFIRIKAGRLKTFATEAEKNEIMELLEKGVIM